MNNKIGFVILLLILILIPLSQAEPLATSYWGYVTVDGITKTNALVTVLDPSGKEVAQATSTQDAMYQVTVPWDDPSTPAIEGVVDGTTITFNIDGKTVTSRPIDPKGTNNRLDLGLSSSSSSSSSSGGGGSGVSGGGGGGASGENFSNIETKENYDLYIFKDQVTSYRFKDSKNPVMFVNITGNVNAGEINTAVEVLKSISTLVGTPAPGTVYKYINIWVGTSGFAGPKNIKDARIMFKLENTWLTSGGIKDADIVLLRWDGAQWVSLETSLSHKDDTFTYYEAKTTSFSPFAISSVKCETAPAGTTSGVSPETTASVTTQAKSTPGFGFVFAAGIIYAVYMLRRKRM